MLIFIAVSIYIETAAQVKDSLSAKGSVMQQTLSEDIDSIEIYAIRWQPGRPYARSPKNFKDLSEFYFSTSEIYLNVFYTDYDEFFSNLDSRLIARDSIHYLNSMVILTFVNKKKLVLYFDLNGNYFFNDKWHMVQPELYYVLFRYFSNIIIPSSTLDYCKKKYRGDFWYDD